jgi:hypothetical protein
MQHFISNSPRSRSALIQAIQQGISHQPEFQTDAVLVLDESAEQKFGQARNRAHSDETGQAIKTSASRGKAAI